MVAWCLAIALVLCASGFCYYVNTSTEKTRLLTLDYINANNKYETQRAARLTLVDEYNELNDRYEKLYKSYDETLNSIEKEYSYKLWATNKYLDCCTFSKTEANKQLKLYKSLHEWENEQHEGRYNFDNVFLCDSVTDVLCVCGIPDDVVVDYANSNTGYEIEGSLEVYLLYYGSSAVLLNEDFQVAGCIHGDTRIPYLDWERP